MSAETHAERVGPGGDYRFAASQVAAAFFGRAPAFSHWDRTARFKVVELDPVLITSGAVVASDPVFGAKTAFEDFRIF